MVSVWNLQTLKITRKEIGRIILTVSGEIWELRQLRHLEIDGGFYLPDPTTTIDQMDILENLQTLLRVRNCRLTEEVVKRIPNVKTLVFEYSNYSPMSKLELVWSFEGSEWFPDEQGGLEFLRLQVLCIDESDLKFWRADNTHFPCLQHLYLEWMHDLVEIPLDFADITTLPSIKLVYCNESTIVSAEKIREERQSLGDDNFRVEVRPVNKKATLN